MDLAFKQKPLHHYTSEELSLVQDMYEDKTYSMPAPPTCTARWQDVDWIRYINTSGKWHP